MRSRLAPKATVRFIGLLERTCGSRLDSLPHRASNRRIVPRGNRPIRSPFHPGIRHPGGFKDS